MTEPEPLQPIDSLHVLFRGRRLCSFSGCDYFRLAANPTVRRAAARELERSNLNVAASRTTTGNHPIYRVLEKKLARFFGAEDALLTSSGYAAPLVAAQALAGNCSHALIDERAHAALQDAAGLLDCPVLRFRHRDPDDFAGAIARCGRGARLIVLTDGLFAHDGSVAPLKAYLRCLAADGLILVDDAHGAGVLGKTGKGTVEAEGVSRQRVIQCIALSKAFGAFGGAVVSSRQHRTRTFTRSRMFRGSTPLALPLASATLAAIKILRTDPRRRERLNRNAEYVREALRAERIDFPQTPGPIIALPAQSQREIARLKRRLLAAGIYPPLVKYPGGPEQGGFRFVISSEHRREHLDRLIEVLTVKVRRATGQVSRAQPP